MGGAIAAAPDPLRFAFEQSTLVVDATVGRSQVGEGDDTAEVVTDLQVDAVLKGEVERRRLKYQHYESREVGEDGIELWRADFAPGTRVVAFLDPSEDGLGRLGRIYEQSSFGWGARHFDDSEQHDAYVERIEALAKLERRNGREVVADAEDLVEWLVATTEEEATRGEEAGELLQAVLALHDHAESSGVSDAAAALELRSIVDRFRDEGGEVTESPRYEVIGAFLTDDQRARLTTALDSSRGFAEPDRTLFSLVLRWDPAAAQRWLAGALAADAGIDGDNEIWWLSSVAEDLGDDALMTIAAEASAKVDAIRAQWPDDETEETDALREEQVLAVSKELRGKFAELLGR
jgi:hypothetical protein